MKNVLKDVQTIGQGIAGVTRHVKLKNATTTEEIADMMRRRKKKEMMRRMKKEMMKRTYKLSLKKNVLLDVQTITQEITGVIQPVKMTLAKTMQAIVGIYSLRKAQE